MNTKEIKEAINTWEKWGYDLKEQEIVCFTSWVVDFDDKKEMFVITYKPKYWIMDVSFKQFLGIIKDKSVRKSFCGFKSEYFTEKEKGIEEFKELFQD